MTEGQLQNSSAAEDIVWESAENPAGALLRKSGCYFLAMRGPEDFHCSVSLISVSPYFSICLLHISTAKFNASLVQEISSMKGFCCIDITTEPDMTVVAVVDNTIVITAVVFVVSKYIEYKLRNISLLERERSCVNEVKH